MISGIVSGASITITEINDGGAETLQIAAATPVNIVRRRILIAGVTGALTIPFANLVSARTLDRGRKFDYIIVGAGSAGCVLAAQLADHLPDASILLVEAGGAVAKTEPLVWDTSLYMVALFNPIPHLEWGYMSEPQQHLNGRTLALTRGKGLGGTSIRNGMVYVRGGEAGFNRWAMNGAPGWDYESNRPHFEAVEAQMAITRAESNPLMDQIMAAAEGAGMSYTDDYNAQRNPTGIGPLQFTIRDGRRETSHTGFIEPRHFENLTILTDTVVQKVVCRRGRARGILFGSLGEERSFAGARQEVILSAGAIASPQLLMLSGIGDARALRRKDIRPRVDLPGVGENLQDDVLVGNLFESTQETPLQPYGIMGVVGFGWAGQGPETETDLQIHFGAGFDPQTPMWSVVPSLLLAESRGKIQLKSPDPFEHPSIDLNLLGTEGDRTRMVEALKFGREIANHSALDAWRAVEAVPGAPVQTDEAILGFLQEQATTAFHYAGTCKMGEGPEAVVDAELRVYGIDRLRVADASIIPTTVSGNTAGATMMIAHKAAEMIAAAAPEKRFLIS